MTIQDINDEIKFMGELVKMMERGKVQDACRHYKEMRDLADQLKETSSRLNKHIEEVKRDKLPMMFKEEGVRSITVDDYRYTISETVRASIASGQKEAAYQWLRDNEMGELITETVNASTLSAQARHLMEEGTELDPDLFNTHLQPNVSVTKS